MLGADGCDDDVAPLIAWIILVALDPELGDEGQAVCEALISADLPMWGGAHTMFRINRDVRFSKNKSPYNPHVRGGDR